MIRWFRDKIAAEAEADEVAREQEAERRFARNAVRFWQRECQIEARRERHHFDLPCDWPA